MLKAMFMKETSRNEEHAALYLTHRLKITNIERRIFPAGPASHDEIITTCRFILVLSGELIYTIEGRSWTMQAGTQFLVPAWVRRIWSVPQGNGCETTWCEFDDGGMQPSSRECVQRKLKPDEIRHEKSQYRSILRLFSGQQPGDKNWPHLRMEGELKSMLVRFLEFAVPLAGPRRRIKIMPVIHPRIKIALHWASEHFPEPNALESLYEHSGMSRNHFRILFKQAMKASPQAYIERLRLLRARYLLHTTNWQLKKIAAEVGYEDALYFSRLYRRYWKHAPSEERESGDMTQ